MNCPLALTEQHRKGDRRDYERSPSRELRAASRQQRVQDEATKAGSAQRVGLAEPEHRAHPVRRAHNVHNTTQVQIPKVRQEAKRQQSADCVKREPDKEVEYFSGPDEIGGETYHQDE